MPVFSRNDFLTLFKNHFGGPGYLRALRRRGGLTQ